MILIFLAFLDPMKRGWKLDEIMTDSPLFPDFLAFLDPMKRGWKQWLALRVISGGMIASLAFLDPMKRGWKPNTRANPKRYLNW